jgi:hypothetical protein
MLQKIAEDASIEFIDNRFFVEYVVRDELRNRVLFLSNDSNLLEIFDWRFEEIVRCLKEENKEKYLEADFEKMKKEYRDALSNRIDNINTEENTQKGEIAKDTSKEGSKFILGLKKLRAFNYIAKDLDEKFKHLKKEGLEV